MKVNAQSIVVEEVYVNVPPISQMKKKGLIASKSKCIMNVDEEGDYI